MKKNRWHSIMFGKEYERYLASSRGARNFGEPLSLNFEEVAYRELTQSHPEESEGEDK